MEIRHARSATKHKIGRQRSAYVVHNALTAVTIGAPKDSSHTTDRTLFLRPDSQGVTLEVMGVEGQRENLLIIHAMPIRRRYEVLLDPLH